MAGGATLAANKIQSWNGYSETVKDGRAQKYIMKPYNKLTGRSLNVRTTPWCQITVVSDFYQTKSVSKYTTTSGCTQAMKWYKNKKRFKKRGTKPKLGWHVFYNFKDSSTSKSTHTGLVIGHKGTSKIIVKEGNAGSPGQVKSRTIAYNSKYIVGFGVPYYK